MQTESKSERVVKSLRASLLIDELDAHIVTAQHFARVTQEELEQLDLKTTDPKQKLLISPFGSIRWSRHLMALLYARQQAMLFMMDACARQLGEDSPFKDDPLFIELAGTSNYEHYERALMFALGARPTTSGPSGRSGSRVAPAVMPGHRARSGSASSRTAQRGSRSNRGRFVELYAHDDQDSPMPPHDCGGYDGTASLEGANGHPSAGSTAGACGTHAPGAGETPALHEAPGHEAVQCSTEPVVAQSVTGSAGSDVDESWILDCADESPMPPRPVPKTCFGTGERLRRCGGYEGALDWRLECALPLGVRWHEGPVLAYRPDDGSDVLQHQGPGGGLVIPGS